MANQKPMKAVSFRLPVEAVKELKKKPEHTKWIQHVVLQNMGKCPVCGSQITKPKEEKTQ